MLNFLKTFILLGAFNSLCATPTLGTENTSQAQLLYDAITPYILTFDIDAHASGDFGQTDLSFTAQTQLLEKLARLIQAKEEIHFLCLAFPFKSSNKELLVEGSLPDMADYHSLEYLENFIIALKEIYPKISLTIMTDGLLFNDLFEIPDKDVIGFEAHLKKIMKDFPNLKLLTFSQVLQEKAISLKSFKEAGTAYKLPKPVPAPRLELLKKRIKHEINHKDHSFSKQSSKQQDILLTRLAIKLIKRDEYLKGFVQRFQEKKTLRLSIHYQSDLSKKIGLKITPTSVIFPWNGVFVIPQNGQGQIMPQGQVDKKRYQKETKMIQGIPLPFYRWRSGV
ncbi:MAG TPA: hypothetical protein DD412_06130 [Holosporales bacterium]|nr:hypothetical protein [Holosporales bacterium]